MIINHISEIMGRYRIGVQDVVRGTGLATNTVSGMYHGTSKRVDLDTLDRLCTYFSQFEPTTIDKLLEYVGKEGTD